MTSRTTKFYSINVLKKSLFVNYKNKIVLVSNYMAWTNCKLTFQHAYHLPGSVYTAALLGSFPKNIITNCLPQGYVQQSSLSGCKMMSSIWKYACIPTEHLLQILYCQNLKWLQLWLVPTKTNNNPVENLVRQCTKWQQLEKFNWLPFWNVNPMLWK